MSSTKKTSKKTEEIAETVQTEDIPFDWGDALEAEAEEDSSSDEDSVTLADAYNKEILFGRNKGLTFRQVCQQPVKKTDKEKNGWKYIEWISEWSEARPTQRRSAELVLEDYKKAKKTFYYKKRRAAKLAKKRKTESN